MFLVGKPERKRLLRKPTSRWEDNIKIDLSERKDKVVWTGFI
jgi:hypothetical protein